MGNRSRTEIVGNILDAANGGATKTKIMYTAFLSYGQLNRFPNFIVFVTGFSNVTIMVLSSNKSRFCKI